MLKSSWCKSSPVKAVAGRPVASVAIRRVTGVCEAYTARKQAVRIYSSDIDHRCDRRHRSWGGRQHPGNRNLRGCPESPESLARGMLPKGFPVNPGELPVSAENWASVWPSPNSTRSPGMRALPQEKRTNPRRAETCCQGKPEVAATGRRAVLRAHSTDEGGEPQGSRKGRPRYTLEGRGEQVDVSARRRMAETQNLENHVKWS